MQKSRVKYIICEGWDASFYEEKDLAERSMEAIDVNNGTYVGYDSAGRLLKFTTCGDKVSIGLEEIEGNHKEELVEYIRSWLNKLSGHPKWKHLSSPDTEDLRELLIICETFISKY